MFNFIEKLEKQEKEYLEKDLTEGTEVFIRTAYELINMVKSKKDKKVIASLLAGMFNDYDVTKTDTYNFRDLKGSILKETNFIEDHIEGKMTMRLSKIQQQSYDNKNIRDQLDRSEKEKAILKEENQELKEARKFEEKSEDGSEAKEDPNPWKRFTKNPIRLENHDPEDHIPQEIKDIGDMILKEIMEDITEEHNKKYAKGGPTGLDPLCRPGLPKLHKIEVRGIAKEPKPWYKIFSKN